MDGRDDEEVNAYIHFVKKEKIMFNEIVTLATSEMLVVSGGGGVFKSTFWECVCHPPKDQSSGPPLIKQTCNSFFPAILACGRLCSGYPSYSMQNTGRKC